MTFLTVASLRHYAATNLMVAMGVAVAVAVLAGALLVGASVRESLRLLALSRLGPTDVVVASTTFFSPEVAGALAAREPDLVRAAAPLISVSAAVVHESSKRVAGRVQVYGVDDRFWRFLEGSERRQMADGSRQSPALRPPGSREAIVTDALARELGAKTGDALLLRLARPTDIPLGSLQGRRDAASERVRVTIASTIEPGGPGEFSLALAQGPLLAVYVPLTRLQQDLEIGDRVNTVIVRGGPGEPAGERLAAAVRERLPGRLTLADRGLRLRPVPGDRDVAIESGIGVLGELERARIQDVLKKLGQAATPVLAYVVNRIRIGEREIPYSAIAAIDLATGAGDPEGSFAIWLNAWAAGDLGARPGDIVSIEYFLWNDAEGLETKTAEFTFAGAVPMDALGGDRTLTPDYPGITDAPDVTSWDPPFPVDLRRVRPQDERYWDEHGAAPKAFVRLETGQRLWGSRFGNVSSIRFPAVMAGTVAADLQSTLGSMFSVQAVRADARAAAEGTTDFGEYFLYFSFFLVVSALLIAYLFFALNVEQRAREIGVLGAVGFAPSEVRAALVRESAVLAVAGAAAGVAGAIGYAQLIMFGLGTWWVGAVGTTALRLHVDLPSLAIGVGGALLAGLAALWLGTRALARHSTRALLAGGGAGGLEGAGGSDGPPLHLSILFSLLGVALVAAAVAGALNPTAAFFGAGGLGLVAGLLGTWTALTRRRVHFSRPGHRKMNPASSLWRFGLSHTRWRPRRTVLSVALIACASFLLVSVGAFRKGDAGGGADRASGTGGYRLMAESVAPLMHDPNTAAGRIELGLDADDPTLDGVRVTRLRLRPGDEASCLALYRPQNPRIVGVDPAAMAGRFTFAATSPTPHATRPEASAWDLLTHTLSGDAVPAIADQTTLTYVLHAAVGDDITIAPDGATPVTLRIVGALADSVLQSEIIIGDAQFVRLFPRNEGYRVWLIETPESTEAEVTGRFEDRLADYGLDVVSTAQRLESYHAVENTYLATFQALGALGLLLGTVGLGAVLARNVLERRREWGLLGAVGYTPAHLRTLVLAESLALAVGGVGLGAAPALVAIVPALRERAQSLPLGELAGVLTAVVMTGVAASWLAVRIATRTPVVAAIKTE